MAMEFTINRDEKVVEIKLGSKVIRREIQINNDGYEFFSVPNLLNNPTHSVINQLFTNRTKDAMETIKNGDGDLWISYYTGGEVVIYFLDRKYGSAVRESFLKSWGDYKFAYTINYGREILMDTNGNFFDTPRYFETENEAEEYLNTLKMRAMQQVKEFESLSDEEKKNFWSENSFSDVEECLFIWELAKTESPYVPCPLRVIQSFRAES